MHGQREKHVSEASERSSIRAIADQNHLQKGTVLLKRELRFLHPWAFGAGVWLMLSLVVSLEHLRSAQPHYLFELSGLMTMLWLEFCFAGMFHTLRKEKGHKAILLLLIALLPPLMLFCINLVLL